MDKFPRKSNHLDMVLQQVFGLLVVYQIKHYLADFPLQIPYMLKKSEGGPGYIRPLSAHCAIHASLTLLIVLFVAPHLWWLAPLDFVIHFVIDRIKSGPKLLGRFADRDSSAYWNIFGLDQMLHHLTHIFFIWLISSQM